MYFRPTLTALAVGLVVASSAQAQTPVVSYTFTGNQGGATALNGFTTYAPGWTTGVSGQTIAMTGINAQGVNNGFGGTSWEQTTAPVSTTNFYTFSLTNNTGSAVTLGSVSIIGN